MDRRLLEKRQEMDKAWSQLTFGSSQRERHSTDKLMLESFRLKEENNEEQAHFSKEVEFHFHQRLQDMKLWLQEFQAKSEKITLQIDKAEIYLKRIRDGLESLIPVLATDKKVLQLREARMGVDLNNDEPNITLTKEIEEVLNEQAQLHKLEGECSELVRLLRKKHHSLGKQIDDKRKALEVDRRAFVLNEHSIDCRSLTMPQTNAPTMQFYRFPMDNETDWAKLSEAECNDIEKLLQKVDHFCNNVESILRQLCEKIQLLLCTTNAAFERHLITLRERKARLEEEHKEISINIREMENCIAHMGRSIVEKESSIALTQKRLEVRQDRPNLENVRDKVFKILELELFTLNDACRQLQHQRQAADLKLRSLLSAQGILEEEINVKMNSIGIDETMVMPLRKTLSVHPQ